MEADDLSLPLAKDAQPASSRPSASSGENATTEKVVRQRRERVLQEHGITEADFSETVEVFRILDQWQREKDGSTDTEKT